MRIYYPSITPVINYTLSYEPESTATIVVAAIGVGIVSMGVIGVAGYFILKKQPPIGAVVSTGTNNRHQGGDDTCKIQIASADLREIEALLIEHRKGFKVL
jgi:hypothetical protein